MSGAPILLAAGGTGGHLFPAEALASVLRGRGRSLVLVTDGRGQAYAERFPGVEIVETRSASPSGKSLGGKAGAAVELLRGGLEAIRLIRRLEPGAVVGFGGYPALPLCAAAVAMRIPLCLHEQNAVLGKVNRLLARWASLIATSFAETHGVPKSARSLLTGNPVRAAIAEIHGAPYAAPRQDDDVHLLVFGGSQGAKIFSDAVPPALALLPSPLRRRLRVSQQVREPEIDAVRTIYEYAGIAADLRPFFADMPAQFRAAHLVIARGGASTVAELTAAGRPSLIAPYPHHKDRHQLTNALNLVHAGAGWILPDGLMTPESVALKISQLIGDPAVLDRAAQAAASLFRSDAALRLADAVEALVTSAKARIQSVPPADSQRGSRFPGGDQAGSHFRINERRGAL